jgi:parvulin-like peptidyl-prolyl isomerase
MQKIKRVISNYNETNQLDTALVQLLKDYELYRAWAISQLGAGRPSKYFTEEERKAATQQTNSRYYQKQKLLKNQG